MDKTVNYRRRGGEGALTLKGTVDIFAAVLLRDAAARAINDTTAVTVRLDVSQVERLDVSAYQILFALHQEIEAQSRTFISSGFPPSVSDSWAKIGCTL